MYIVHNCAVLGFRLLRSTFETAASFLERRVQENLMKFLIPFFASYTHAFCLYHKMTIALYLLKRMSSLECQIIVST